MKILDSSEPPMKGSYAGARIATLGGLAAFAALIRAAFPFVRRLSGIPNTSERWHEWGGMLGWGCGIAGAALLATTLSGFAVRFRAMRRASLIAVSCVVFTLVSFVVAPAAPGMSLLAAVLGEYMLALPAAFFAAALAAAVLAAWCRRGRPRSLIATAMLSTSGLGLCIYGQLVWDKLTALGWAAQ
ncbi:MAG TPA: hypothetical protein VGM03_15535 [Phycisphaerae bacterium]|jgi:hypothetical protein